MKLIDGKMTAAAIKEEIKAEVDQMIAAGMKRPHLAAVLVGHDGGSEAYVKNKVIACEKCGFKSSLIRMDEDATEEQLLDCIRGLNEDADVDGFIVQLPLPKHIDEQKVINTIDYRKDVDGIHPMNAGRMTLGLPRHGGVPHLCHGGDVVVMLGEVVEEPIRLITVPFMREGIVVTMAEDGNIRAVTLFEHHFWK